MPSVRMIRQLRSLAWILAEHKPSSDTRTITIYTTKHSRLHHLKSRSSPGLAGLETNQPAPNPCQQPTTGASRSDALLFPSFLLLLQLGNLCLSPREEKAMDPCISRWEMGPDSQPGEFVSRERGAESRSLWFGRSATATTGSLIRSQSRSQPVCGLAAAGRGRSWQVAVARGRANISGGWTHGNTPRLSKSPRDTYEVLCKRGSHSYSGVNSRKTFTSPGVVIGFPLPP